EAPGDLEQRAAELILEEREEAFDLTVGPLFRIKLLRLTDTDYFLLVTMHHIISDHGSMQIFRTELAKLYEAFSQGKTSPLAEPVIQFVDYSLWERRLIDDGHLDEQLAFWKDQLGGPLSRLNFKKHGIEENELSFRTARLPIELDETLFTDIKALARKENCTPFMVLLAALSILLYLQTGQEDIRIGTLVANRSRPESRGVFGHFINTIILRIELYPDMTWKQLLMHVRQVTL